MKIAVGLSGGVDSTLTALLLKEQGHEVVGLTMALYNGDIPNLKVAGDACYGPTEKQDIKEVAAWCKSVGIEHHVINLSEAYKSTVLKYFRDTYLSGETPNPCIMCNAGMKFGLLIDEAKKQTDFDAFATGHYARIEKGPDGFILMRGVEAKKDQSYFLYRLTQEQLAHTIFPLGQYTKAQVREMAKERDLAVADKPDSQDFYAGDYADLLQVEDKEGKIVLTDGKVLGKHNGFWHYTIGQRKGLGIAYPEPLYVVDLDPHHNRVIVGTEAETKRTSCNIVRPVWGVLANGKTDFKCLVKYRSAGQLVPAHVFETKDGVFQIDFETPQKSLTPGQSAVLYDGDLVLGGGFIK
ncbi:MAG: tRNA 2-thiouridine(34) synthase MnmA [Alphaproteobacteria bacterium]|nr:tRNA 2-thiouridine(34) synthase MnmA [Alphaproteobacteria bacterium]